jgi:pSer/pThr/pTyr-binding forkhead associated (FHA) protein
LIIGRGVETNVTILNEVISRIHSIITISDDGKVYIEDCGSTNGTFINSWKLGPIPDKYVVNVGDYIGFSCSMLVKKLGRIELKLNDFHLQ